MASVDDFDVYEEAAASTSPIALAEVRLRHARRDLWRWPWLAARGVILVALGLWAVYVLPFSSLATPLPEQLLGVLTGALPYAALASACALGAALARLVGRLWARNKLRNSA